MSHDMSQVSQSQEAGSAQADEPADGELSHREIMLGLSGPLLGMFVALLSSSIVVNALPRIIPELGGSQTGYTWVIIATFLTLTTFNPIWGKLADLFDLKRLLAVALVIYVAGGVVGAAATSLAMLIASRGVIGLGLGGISTLSQAVIARLAPPRQRGKYAGYIGVSYALGTVCGPLVGGVIADSPLGWRGCFFVPLPLAILAFLLMRRTLKIKHVRRETSIDYLGATFLITGIGLLLVLLSLGGSSFEWLSGTAAAIGTASAAGLAVFVLVEAKVAREPIVQLTFFRKRTITLIVLCTVLCGVAPFSSTTYLSEYYQYARGLDPTQSGLLIVPMVLGLTITGLVSGRIVARTGAWKPVALAGMAALIAGMLLIGTSDRHTPLAAVAGFSAVFGVGVGAITQNLVLAVQNVVDDSVVGSVTSLIFFAQSLGGTLGVTILGAVLSHTVARELPMLGDGLPSPTALPPGIRDHYQSVMGSGIADLFTLMAPAVLLGAVLCMLTAGTKMRLQRELEAPAHEGAAS